MRLTPSDEGYTCGAADRDTAERRRDNENGRVEGTGPERGHGWLLHAQASLRFGALRARRRRSTCAAIDARCRARRTAEDPRGLRSKQEDHLNFGPRWRVLHQACYGERRGAGPAGAARDVRAAT